MLFDKNKSDFPQENEEIGYRRFHRPSRKGVRAFIAGMVCMAVLAVGGYQIYMRLPISSTLSSVDSLQMLRKIKQVNSLIESNYLSEADEELIADYMILGMISGLEDKYSTYYTAEQYEEILQKRSGTTEGIGLQGLNQEEDGSLSVAGVLEDSPADRAGLQVGDILIAVNGTTVEGMASDEAIAIIREALDDTIELSVRRDGEELTMSMEAETLEVQAVTGAMFEGEIGYIRISTFNELTPTQFEEIYGILQEEGMKGLILDLRGNLGGLVKSCVDTLSKFMPEGIMVYEVDKNSGESSRSSAGESPIDIPMAVLVNSKTASASEIFVGAIQDYEIGTIIGTVTYGKGVEQNSYVLGDGSVVKLTYRHYYTPNHNDLNEVGITPDIEVEDEQEQLQTAFETIQEMID